MKPNTVTPNSTRPASGMEPVAEGSVNVNLLLIPEWVEKALEGADWPLRKVLDPDVLSTTLSREDVAFYVFLNRHINRWLPDAVRDTFECGTEYSLKFRDLTEFEGEVTDLVTYHEMQDIKATQGGERVTLDTRELFGPLSDPIDPKNLRYVIREIQYDTIAVIPKQERGDGHKGMVDYLLLLLSQRLSFEELARTPLFKYYVQII